MCFQATKKTLDFNESDKLKKLREEWEAIQMNIDSPIDIVT